MANEQNLIPGGYKLSREEASKGGKNSGETRRMRRKMREDLEYLMSIDNNQEEGLMAMIARWIKTGDPKIATFLRDTLGEAPQINIGVGSVGSDELKNLSDEDLRRLAEDADAE